MTAPNSAEASSQFIATTFAPANATQGRRPHRRRNGEERL